MNVEVIEIQHVRSGQPRAYADSETVKVFRFGYRAENSSQITPVPLALAKNKIKLLSGKKPKSEVDMSNINEYFKGWIEYIYDKGVDEEGFQVIEVKYIDPFTD